MNTEIPPEVLVPVLNGIGAIIKHAVPRIDNRWIPIILAILGTVGAVLVATEITPMVVIRGFGAAAIAVGLHQMATTLTPSK